jgi:hypothetical protein
MHRSIMTTITLSVVLTFLFLLSGIPLEAQWNVITGTDAEVIVHGGNGFGSTNTIVRRFSTVDLTIGTSITYADDSVYGASFLVNDPGVYTVNYTDQRTDTAFPYFYYYIDIDHSPVQSTVSTILSGSTMSAISSSGPYMIGKNTITIVLDKGDVVRPWWFANNPGGTYADGMAQFIITKVR